MADAAEEHTGDHDGTADDVVRAEPLVQPDVRGAHPHDGNQHRERGDHAGGVPRHQPGPQARPEDRRDHDGVREPQQCGECGGRERSGQRVRHPSRAFEGQREGEHRKRRDGRGVRLTEAGALLAAGAVDVQTALERVQARWDAYLGEPSGVVTVAALPSAAEFLLGGVLAELDDLPLEVRCDDTDVAEAKYAELTKDYDIVVGHSLRDRPMGGAPPLHVVRLVREPLDIAVPARHSLAGHRRLRAEEIVDEDWVAAPLGFPFDSVLGLIESRTGRSPHVVQRIKDNRVVESLVAAGLGLAVLPRFTTRPGRHVVLRPLAGDSPGRHVFALVRPDRAERAGVQRVLTALTRVAERTARQHGTE